MHVEVDTPRSCLLILESSKVYTECLRLRMTNAELFDVSAIFPLLSILKLKIIQQKSNFSKGKSEKNHRFELIELPCSPVIRLTNVN